MANSISIYDHPGHRDPSSLNLGLRQSVGNDPAYLAQDPTQGIGRLFARPGDAAALGRIGSHLHQPARSYERHHAVRGGHGALRDPVPEGPRHGPRAYDRRIAHHAGSDPAGAGRHVFDASGNGTVTQGITNPFWVAANSYFRALGIKQADPSVQLPYVVLPARSPMRPARGARIWRICGSRPSSAPSSPVSL